MALNQRPTPKVTRKPTADERKAATRLAQALRKVTYPSRAKTRVATDVPPGRLNSRQAALATYQRQQRVQQTAKPFVAVKMDRTVHTPLRVGIACDISGSMRPAEEPLAVARWVLADALHQVQGEVAAVLFGNEAHGIQAPRERVTEVIVHSHNGGSEDYVGGFSMLDSALDLIDGEGARLLVIFTDGHFVRADATQYAEVTMDMCRRAGVAVLWVNVSGYFARQDAFGHGTIVEAAHKSPIEVADLLGAAVIDAFRTQAKQHSLARA